MTVTYPADPQKPYGDRVEAPRLDAARDEPFVPVYARSGRAAGRGKIRTWMIMVPVGALALGGLAAMMMTDSRTDAPLAEPAATAPVLPATAPLAAVPAAPLTPAAAPAPVAVAAAPAVRETAPVRRAAPAPAPVRRVAPRAEATVAPRATAPAPAAAPTVGPQPYAPAPAGPTSSLNTAPTPPAPTPIVVVAPQG